jgi:hypothetical protein
MAEEEEEEHPRCKEEIAFCFGAMGRGGDVVTTTQLRGKLAELSILPACIYVDLRQGCL